MSYEGTAAAAADILHNLAKGAGTSPGTTAFDPKHSEGLGPFGKIQLPGPDNEEKRSLETEIGALIQRINLLEAKANTVNHQSFPDTPNEFSDSYPFDGRSPVATSNRSTAQASVRNGGNGRGSSRVSNLLAARVDKNGDTRTVSEDDISYLREHVNKQAEEIKNNRSVITSVSEQLQKQTEQTKSAFVRVEQEEIAKMQRELKKHAQTNEAFLKAFREIGTIITQVAKGDLSMKVQIHAAEVDPEITTFKKAINTMMDQLQEFGSEVSRVAREVGTQGVLGGQAQVSGVQGIWKELTENGL